MVYTNLNNLRVDDYSGNIKDAITFLLANKEDICKQEVGKYEVDPNFFYMIQEYMSKDTTVWEGHQKYIDIQLILDGEETMLISNINHLTVSNEYDSEKDWVEFEGDSVMSILMKPNDLTIFYPEDIHKPGLKTNKGNTPVRKCLFKVLL